MNYRWKRTALTRADGSPILNDWALTDEQEQIVARLFKIAGGPHDGQWFWAVIIDQVGHNGYCATGAEARIQCEALMFRDVRK